MRKTRIYLVLSLMIFSLHLGATTPNAANTDEICGKWADQITEVFSLYKDIVDKQQQIIAKKDRLEAPKKCSSDITCKREITALLREANVYYQVSTDLIVFLKKAVVELQQTCVRFHPKD